MYTHRKRNNKKAETAWRVVSQQFYMGVYGKIVHWDFRISPPTSIPTHFYLLLANPFCNWSSPTSVVPFSLTRKLLLSHRYLLNFTWGNFYRRLCIFRDVHRKFTKSFFWRLAILCPRLGTEWIGRMSWLPRSPGRLWDRFLCTEYTHLLVINRDRNETLLVSVSKISYIVGTLPIFKGGTTFADGHKKLHFSISFSKDMVGLFEFILVRKSFLGIRPPKKAKNRTLKFLNPLWQ